MAPDPASVGRDRIDGHVVRVHFGKWTGGEISRGVEVVMIKIVVPRSLSFVVHSQQQDRDSAILFT